MILFGGFLSPFVRRVAATLNYYEIPYEHNPISHSGDDAPVLRKTNPVGRVPALVLDDGTALIDSANILDYLDHQVSADRALTPVTGEERFQINNLVSVATGAAEKAIATVYEKRFRPEEKRHQPWVDRCADQAKGGFDYLESQLGDDGFIAGKLTQADITTAIAWQFVGITNPKLQASIDAPKIAALAERLMETPAFADTYPG